ncbi:MAG: DUF4178 domain-containing protein [Acidobacteria bacterium]|nr:DUF4178 domain-containing protein [Acidobacteriota bacterium]
MPTAGVVQVRSLFCPNCGGGVDLRGMGASLSAVCAQCLSILDTSTPLLKILQTFHAKTRIQPTIPLGTRGKWNGVPYELIGFMVRSMKAEGVTYTWQEYVLFNPFKGFRYLTEYRGHWNDVKVIRSLPEAAGSSRGAEQLRVQGGTYRHFQTYNARVEYVLGEFPWRVKVGDSAELKDYIDPPRMLSSEQTAGEVAWSLGEYIPGSEVWKNFGLPGTPSPAKGIYANQPSPFTGRVGGIWRLCLLFLIAAFALSLWFSITSRQEDVYSGSYSYTPRQKGEAAFVTPVFELKGRPSNVEILTQTDLENNWVFLNFALINEQTSQAYDFGREVSYYQGRDSDGSWSEGKMKDDVTIPTVPAGRYFLRIEPEMAPDAPREVNYTVRVRRDVPTYWFIWLAALFLLLPPIFTWFRAHAFETARWNESDHATSSSSSSGDDD